MHMNILSMASAPSCRVGLSITMRLCLRQLSAVLFERISEVAGKLGRQAEIIEMRRIKKYSPGVWHVVVDARVD